jgi:hypothetical protein
MTSPMPPRLDAENQKAIDGAWNKALTPVGKLDRQSVLDLMVLRYAFEVGVDKLHFRSEKRFDGGTVVMTIAFDRAKPAEDTFDVVVLDKAGREVRTEHYTRADIERATEAFHHRSGDLQKKKDQGTATAAERQELAAIEARVTAVNDAYPPIQGALPEVAVGNR